MHSSPFSNFPPISGGASANSETSSKKGEGKGWNVDASNKGEGKGWNVDASKNGEGKGWNVRCMFHRLMIACCRRDILKNLLYRGSSMAIASEVSHYLKSYTAWIHQIGKKASVLDVHSMYFLLFQLSH